MKEIPSNAGSLLSCSAKLLDKYLITSNSLYHEKDIDDTY